MIARELKDKYFAFFEKKGHKKLPNVSLVPKNDTTALFISAGMHPLVPYFLGEVHPQGKRLVSLQRCLRTTDIDKVGNPTHSSFFEMLGNWSLGDSSSSDGVGQGGYWKKEAISWSFEFLTTQLRIDPRKLYVTCFAGDEDAPRDKESAEIWRQLGIPSSRIFFLGKNDNWWGPVGKTGPCGPDTEMFIDTGKKACSLRCKPGCSCGKYIEVWNDVFMEYERKVKKQKNGKKEYELSKLKQKSVDTGMGVERVTAILQGKDDIYQTELFWPIIKKIGKLSGKNYKGRVKKPIRIIADHVKAATFLIIDGVLPSNKKQGYVLRRLLRRAAVKMFTLSKDLALEFALEEVAKSVLHLKAYDSYFVPKKDEKLVSSIVGEEIARFSKTLEKGLKFASRIKHFDGKAAFDLYQTYGFPFEITQELAFQADQEIKKEEFDKEFKKHQKISRADEARKFSGGLADYSEETTKLHTATHLLHQALREVLSDKVIQRGSNITPKRLRFDFSWSEKLSSEQIDKIEKLVNKKINQNLPVKMEVMSLSEAKKKGALALFGQKYGSQVKTYRIGNRLNPFSFEVCGGPHVDFTGSLGKFKIIKEESAGAGVRRIYACLVEDGESKRTTPA